MNQLSVRTRLTLWNIGVVALALAVFGVGLVVVVERVLIDSVDRTLRQRMERFVGEVTNRPRRDGRREGPPPEPRFFPFGGFPQQGPFPPGEGRGPEGGGRGPRGPGQRGPGGGPPGGGDFPRRLLELDTNADRLTGAPPLSPRGFEQARTGGGGVFATENPATGPVRVYSFPLRQDGRTVNAVLQVAEPIGEVGNARQGLIRALLLMIPAALLLAGMGGALLAERALRPVRALTLSAARIEAQNLSDRLPVTGQDEFGRLAAILNGMLERLDRAFKSERRFTADASHELRTPLAVIKANSSLMREEADVLSPEHRESLQAIDEAADRANRIVRDLLFLARAEGVGASLPVQVSEVDVATVVRRAWEAASAARKAAPETDNGPARLPAFRSSVPEGLTLSTDRDHLTRLLTNLLENAARHTPPEGTVTVQAVPATGSVTLTVTDTGEGIAPEHLARLGTAFYRADAARTRTRGGAGLGLAICRTLARALGGELAIKSILGRGTEVTVTLPRKPSG